MNNNNHARDQRYKLVASDLDGTLLNAEHKISAFTQDVLARLNQQGEHFVFATGRHHIDVATIRDNLGIPAFMITSNGARVHDDRNNLIYSADIDSQLVPALINLAKDDRDIFIHLYQENKWLLSRPDSELAQYHSESGFNFELFDVEQPPTEHIAKLFYTHHDHEHLCQYEQQLRANFGDSVSIAFSTPYCLEVMDAGVSKGAALKAVAALKGVTLAECIAFGDGMNDVEMLTAVKKGLVMGNAPAKVKASLSQCEVIGNNQEEAVAHYLEANLLTS